MRARRRSQSVLGTIAYNTARTHASNGRCHGLYDIVLPSRRDDRLPCRWPGQAANKAHSPGASHFQAPPTRPAGAWPSDRCARAPLLDRWRASRNAAACRTPI